MERDGRQEALDYLIKQAENQGYVTFDDIMDCADENSLLLQDFDWLSNAITTRGILVYDDIPTGRLSEASDDEYDDYAQSDYEAVYKRIFEIAPDLEMFVTQIKNIKPPQWKEFSQLKYQVLEGNQHARTRMIEMHLRLALRIALQRAEAYDADLEDTVGEACIGLVTAIDKYNPDVNGAFGSYASMWILQCITRHQPTCRPLVYYPVNVKEMFFSAYSLLKQRRLIEDDQIIDEEEARRLIVGKLSLTNEQANEVLLAMKPFESFENKFGMFAQNKDGFEKHEKQKIQWGYNENIPNELIYEANIEDSVMDSILKEQIADVLSELNEKERQVLELRYGLAGGEAKTLEEVGEVFNVTRERIRQIEAKALRKLRHPTRSKRLKDFIDFV